MTQHQAGSDPGPRSVTARRARGPVLGAALALAVPGLLGLPSLAAADSGPAAASGRVRTVDYQESDAVIPNPARGFYHHTETHYREDGSGYTPLDEATLRGYRDEGITQILRVVYLEKFADSATLDPAFLELVQADLDTARAAGVSVILRFAYAQGGAWPYSPPYGDAPLDVVLAHIDQLTPLLRENADVIAVVQQGFIGLWGEGYYTDHFASDPANPGVLTDADWEKRATVLQALLDAVPEDRMVQVRTMVMKQRMLGVPTGAAGALTPEQAYSGTDLARVGHHNDCFLASPDDFGTFLSDPLELDQEYLALDSRYVPVGGETCAVNPPRSDFASAAAEMARYHYSYLNTDYNRDVLDRWGEEGLAEAARRLGYRFVLEESRVRTAHARGGAVTTVEADVRNEGWAAPYDERPVQLVLRGARGTWVVPTGVDARDWAPGTTSTLSVPVCGVPTGRYALSLALPAADASTADDPDYAVQLANVGTWDAATGENDLHQDVLVTGQASCGESTAVPLGR